MPRRPTAPADTWVLRTVGREPVNHDSQRIDAQHRRDDPLDEGVLPATLIPHAGPRLDRPIAVEAERDRGAAAADVPDAKREPDAAPRPPRLVGTHLRRGTIQEPAEIRTLPRLPRRRRIAGARDGAPAGPQP